MQSGRFGGGKPAPAVSISSVGLRGADPTPARPYISIVGLVGGPIP